MRGRILFGFILLHAVLFLVVFTIACRRYYFSPGELELQYATAILNGQVPYRDFATEYPPLALASFLLPAIFFRSLNAYIMAFAVEMLVLDIIVLLLLDKLAVRLKKNVLEQVIFYTLFIMAIGPIIVIRYDMLPAALTLIALWAFISGRNNTSWVSLGLGTVAKVYPVVIAPITAGYHLLKKQYHRMTNGIVIFLVVVGALSIPWLIIDARGFLSAILYHAERGLHWESTYASVFLIGNIMHKWQINGKFDFGSWNIDSPVGDAVARATTFIVIGLLLVVYLLYVLKTQESKQDIKNNRQAEIIIGYSLLEVLVFILAGKVFSAQYLIWVAPLLPLISGGKRARVQWIFFIVAAAITQYVFPYHYVEFESSVPYLVILMAVRNALLIAMALLLLWPHGYLAPKIAGYRNK